MGLYASRPQRAGPRQDRRGGLDHRAGHRRGFHARVYEGMEAADARRARPCGPAPTVSAAPERDPSRSSYYVDDRFYQELAESFTDWQGADREITDAALRDEARLLLER